MTNQTVLDVLIRAMITEQDGYDFYVAAGEHISDEKGKEMFRGLANDEIEHLHILQAEYAKVNDGQSFVDLEAARKELPSKPDLKLFPEKSQLSAMLDAAGNDEKALKVALDFELRGYNMYDQAAQNATDANAREIYAYLAQQENHHYELIQQTLDYLMDKGMWFFQDGEMPIFEG